MCYHTTYKIELSVVVKSLDSAYYTYFETLGVMIPNYGFMVNEDILFDTVEEISKNLMNTFDMLNN